MTSNFAAGPTAPGPLAAAPSGIANDSRLRGSPQRDDSPDSDAQSTDCEAYLLEIGRWPSLLLASSVVEIIARPRELTPVPTPASWLLGVTHHRGNLLPLFDLSVFLAGHQSGGPDACRSEPKVIVVSDDNALFGLLISRLLGNRGLRDCAPARTEAESGPLDRWTQGIHQVDGQRVPILDPARIASDLQSALIAADSTQSLR